MGHLGTSGWVPEHIARRYTDVYTGRVVSEPVRREVCWKCDRPGVGGDVAHQVYEYVASLLGERVRRALDEHVAGCDRLCVQGRVWTCEEYQRIYELVPLGFLPVAIA